MRFKKIMLFNVALMLVFCACQKNVTNTSIYEGCCGNLPLSDKVGTIPIYVPNVFTPNFDLVNDALAVLAGGNIGKISDFIVKDKSGNIVWQSGTKLYNANESIIWTSQEVDKVPEGKLSYSFKVVPTTGATLQFQGFICKNISKDADCPAKNAACVFGTQVSNGVLDSRIPNLEFCK
jgi:hypothetical protein